MKTLLFINACVRSKSRTHRLAKGYLETCIGEEQYTVIERDVTKLKLLPMNEEDINRRDEAINRHDYIGEDFSYAKEFAAADKIVIAAPYWDCSFPSFLKLYFEHIMVRDIVLGYSESGETIKLCKAGSLVYITTSGGYIREKSSVQCQIEELADLFGITKVQFYCAEAMDIYPDRTEDILKGKLGEMCEDDSSIC